MKHQLSGTVIVSLRVSFKLFEEACGIHTWVDASGCLVVVAIVNATGVSSRAMGCGTESVCYMKQRPLKSLAALFKLLNDVYYGLKIISVGCQKSL